MLRDPRLVWPDGLFVSQDAVYVTLGQWDRLGKGFDLQSIAKLASLKGRTHDQDPAVYEEF